MTDPKVSLEMLNDLEQVLSAMAAEDPKATEREIAAEWDRRHEDASAQARVRLSAPGIDLEAEAVAAFKAQRDFFAGAELLSKKLTELGLDAEEAKLHMAECEKLGQEADAANAILTTALALLGEDARSRVLKACATIASSAAAA